MSKYVPSRIQELRVQKCAVKALPAAHEVHRVQPDIFDEQQGNTDQHTLQQQRNHRDAARDTSFKLQLSKPTCHSSRCLYACQPAENLGFGASSCFGLRSSLSLLYPADLTQAR